jgi:acyl CoA:acetate/3-ketoacid CoA transferase alpha subunit
MVSASPAGFCSDASSFNRFWTSRAAAGEVSRVRETRGAPIVIPAQITGSSIQPAIDTGSGLPTPARHGQNERAMEVGGKTYLLETALHADFALVHTFLADYLGNLSYALTARNFNPVMAMAADTVIVTAENIVPVGVIAPDHVVTPGPLVDYLIANG